jgi:hypothetical protein
VVEIKISVSKKIRNLLKNKQSAYNESKLIQKCSLLDSKRLYVSNMIHILKNSRKKKWASGNYARVYKKNNLVFPRGVGFYLSKSKNWHKTCYISEHTGKNFKEEI